MKIFSTYKVKIKHYNHIFKDTVDIYRKAVDYLLAVCLNEWNNLSIIKGTLDQQSYVEKLIHTTKNRTTVKYDFDQMFYKFPSYLRRGTIQEALGKISSYQSNLANWNLSPTGKSPSVPKAGYVYPCMYRTVMYEQTGTYEARIKVFTRNTWDWLSVALRKSDIEYINRRCSNRKSCAPTLQKRGKEWYLDFPFEESTKLCDVDITDQTIVSVDLGINTPATISVMKSDGTILGRHFCKLPIIQDSLNHSVNRIKKAQQHGNFKTPILWARAKGLNHQMSVLTAQFIMDTAVLYNADTIVFEHLDRIGKLWSSKKQKLHLWRSQEVQAIVTNKAHRLHMRISHINAWGTSRLAYDGSGRVERGVNGNYSTCQFPSGKTYNCDLSASYNIGARYYIREILKSLNESLRLQLEAKVPQACKRSTCTFSTLVNLNAVLAV